MAAYYADLYEALETAVVAVWPDIVQPDGGRAFYDAEHIENIPFEQIANQVVLPAAVVHIPSVPASDEWGVANDTYEVPVELMYLAKTQGGATDIRAKLEAMRDYVRPRGTGLTVGQVLSVDELTWSSSLPLNQGLRERKLPMLAGRLTFTVLVGETP